MKLECTRGDIRLLCTCLLCSATLTHLLLQLPFAVRFLMLMRYQAALRLYLALFLPRSRVGLPPSLPRRVAAVHAAAAHVAAAAVPDGATSRSVKR